MDGQVELLTDGGNLCGEAPLWDYRIQCLFWVDQDDPGLFSYTPAGSGTEIVDRSVQISGIALNKRGGLVAGGRKGLFLWEKGIKRKIIDSFEGKPLIFNDIVAGPEGRVYGGTVYWDETGMAGAGRLYRFEPNGETGIEDEGILLSNGLAFSPDNRTLYFSDSGNRTIFSYHADPGTGRLSGKRVFAVFPEDEGIPDGITCDSDGFLWAALWYGGSVVRIDPEGVVEQRIPLPVKQVSSVMFGGQYLNDLYVTSAKEYWPSSLQPPGFKAESPMGGGLYRIACGCPGIREHMADF